MIRWDGHHEISLSSDHVLAYSNVVRRGECCPESFEKRMDTETIEGDTGRQSEPEGQIQRDNWYL